MDILETIIRELINDAGKSGADLAMIKRKMAKKFKVPCPTNISLLRTYHKLVENKTLQASLFVKNLLITRPVRSLSGVVNISVLTKPYPCPGKCIYCPSQKGSPKSYLNNEPAVMRAILNKYDPYDQVKMRLRALEMTGHPTDKVELRIVGGTWSFYPKRYQTWFVNRCFDACNDKTDIHHSQKINETARHRIVGLSIETRPDFITKKEIQRLRGLGATMVELGVQSTYDDVLQLIKRGHGRNETIRATKLLKDAGFKICYQMMLNLPGANTLMDKKMFGELFSNSDFQPDMLKIYPCALLKETPLYRWWKNKKYKPYAKHQLITLVKSIKKMVPPYVRIQRITRDIPSRSIIAGPAKLSNLRQIITEHCECIRCREVRGAYNSKEKLFLFRRDYKASGGKEIFLTFENKNRGKLYSLLRLRIGVENGSRPFAVIREVHTYGQSIDVRPPTGGRPSPASPQHKGFGKKLVQEAEKIVRDLGIKKIKVISGVGVRGYYRKLGYKIEKTYMTKRLNA